MLSDEEKELIDKIQKGNKIGIYELIRTFKKEGIENFITVRRKYIDIMINLIEKQQKAIDQMSKELSKVGMYKSNVSAYEIYERGRNIEMVKMTPEEIKNYFMEE